MFKYNIINKYSFNINQTKIKNIFNSSSKIINKTQKGTLNIVFLNEQDIQELNNNYRKIDKVTDVLSFHYYDDFSNLKKDEIAGEIIMCENKIISQGLEYGLGSEFEFYKLLIHSILHILGYDHENDYDYKIMNEFENKIYSEVFE